jgi:hypothetical protein
MATEQAGRDQPDPDPAPGTPGNRLLTPAQVAEICGGKTTSDTVVRGYKRWGLKGHKVGRELRFAEKDVWEWIKDHPA